MNVVSPLTKTKIELVMAKIFVEGGSNPVSPTEIILSEASTIQGPGFWLRLDMAAMQTVNSGQLFSGRAGRECPYSASPGGVVTGSGGC